jgi:hypothetical protein
MSENRVSWGVLQRRPRGTRARVRARACVRAVAVCSESAGTAADCSRRTGLAASRTVVSRSRVQLRCNALCCVATHLTMLRRGCSVLRRDALTRVAGALRSRVDRGDGQGPSARNPQPLLAHAAVARAHATPVARTHARHAWRDRCLRMRAATVWQASYLPSPVGRVRLCLRATGARA